jgi:hypothetical protein
MSDPARYPLCWPAGKPRTPAHRRRRAPFKTTLGAARDELLNELKLLGACGVIVSSNLRLRRDDLPYADQREPEDGGVAVYFSYDGLACAFACDQWVNVRDNLRAVCLTINALRGISRWGTGDMVRAAFTGFAQLPAARMALRPWHEVIGVAAHAPADDVHAAYRLLAKERHPDRGGDHEAMVELNDAYERFKRERGL